MTTTELTIITGVDQPNDVSKVPMRFEVTSLPVADVDRAKTFYEQLGWRFDIDFTLADGTRGVQFTPPASQASVQFTNRYSSSESLKRLLLIVDDIDVAHDELVNRGIEVSDVFHASLGEAPEPGRDPERRSYASHFTFSDPDGNEWVVQEVTERLPGRVESTDVASLSALLLETAQHHDTFEKVAQPHDWFDWYGAYMAARQDGADSDAAAAAADTYMADVKGVTAAA